MTPRTAFTIVALLCAGPACAEGRYRGGPTDYGYAGDFVRGAYVGAPLTRVPRPSQIVPAPWSYGTYGIPTVTGIPPAPAAQPTITVIDATGPKPRGRRVDPAPDGDHAGAARIIAVRVPRR